MSIVPDEADILALRLNSRTEKQLHAAGYNTVGELCAASAVDLLKLPNFGSKSLEEVRECLAFVARGLRGQAEPRSRAITFQNTSLRSELYCERVKVQRAESRVLLLAAMLRKLADETGTKSPLIEAAIADATKPDPEW